MKRDERGVVTFSTSDEGEKRGRYRQLRRVDGMPAGCKALSGPRVTSAAMTTDKIFLVAYGRLSAVQRSGSYARAHMSRHRYPSLSGLHAETPCFRIFRLADSTAGSAAI